MGSELKPCPFCGGEAAKSRYQDYDQGKRKTGWQMSAVECAACDVAFYCDEEHEAIAAWNRRTPPQPSGGEVERAFRAGHRIGSVAREFRASEDGAWAEWSGRMEAARAALVRSEEGGR